ncbi:MAG TPA: tetratricopeptide repeat protein, partial [Rugosimonospora sp.]|nr:tetratricopeptide repeat protein [Rugosimonospora sp.]
TAGQQPLTPYAALDLLLRNSGVPQEQVPPDLDGRTSLWRSLTARKRILLLLDNAKSADHVRALLPNASGSLVVVTSRRRLSDLEGATPVLLDVLPMPDAVDLFQRCAGGAAARSPDGAAGIARIVEACGRLPLAIRIAASRLRNRPNWTVADLAERLTEHRRRARLLTVDDQTVASVLGLSYRYLEPEAQRLFRLLAVHPGSDLDAYAAAALVGWPVEQTEDVLDRLVEDNLVHQGTDRRYRLHDLVRDCAITMSEAHDCAADRDLARHRLFDYYLHLAFTHCAPMARGPYRITPVLAHPPAALPRRSGPGAGLRVLKDEYQNLVDVAHAATQYGLREHAWQLPCVLQPFLTRMHYREQSLPLFQAALSAAWALGDERAESAALGSIALIMRERGEYAETQDLFDRAIAISRRLGDTASEVYQLADLGYAQRLAGQLSRAHATFAEAARLAERTGDREGYGTVVNSLGVVDLAIGRTDVAVRHFEAALSATREGGSRQDEALVLGNLAWARTAQDDPAAALPLFDASITISRSIEYRYGE